MYLGESTELLPLCNRSIHIADSLQDTFRLAKSVNMLANAYKLAGLMDKAMKHYLESLELFEAVGDQKWLSNMHSNIGSMFLNKGDYQQAQKEQEIALSIRKKIGYYNSISGIYNSLGNIQDMRENHDSARYYYALALDSAVNEANPYNRAMYLGNLGNAYGSLRQFNECLKYNREALALHFQLGMTQQSSRDYHNIGEAHLLQDHIDSAKHYLKLAFLAADSTKYHKVMYVASNQLVEAYRKEGDYKEALKWADIAAEEMDSLHQSQIYEESQSLELSYRIAQQERELEFEQETALFQKDEQIKRQQILNISMGLGIFLLAGFGFVVNKRYREKKQVNTLLEKTVAERTSDLRSINERLQQEVEMKEKASKTLNKFIYRSSHDLKGPLMSIKGLVDIAKTENEQSHYVGLIGAKTNQLDMVLQQLIDKVELDAHESQPRLLDWANIEAALHTQMAQHPKYKDSKIELNCTKAEAVVADPVLLQLILRQIIQNSLDAGETAIQIDIQAQGKGKSWTLTVSDNGPGIPENMQAKVFEMFYRGSNSAGTGLGLYLAKAAANKMAADISVESKTDLGTKVMLSFG